MQQTTSQRRIERVRHELLRRDVIVTRVEHISPGFLAITFGSDSLASFISLSFDDHVKFILEDAKGNKVMRDFTPRSFDLERRELTLEFALHERGGACDWARQAKVGDAAVIGGPRGSMIIPIDYEWHLLAGDATALPAIHRRLEELPQGSRVWVVAHVEDAVDQRIFKSAATVSVLWVNSAEALVQALRTIQLPDGEGFAWCAAEAAVIARVRDVLLSERKWPVGCTRISAYWKRGEADFSAVF
jgi:NADPH-dependent ferric siderophore reductase